MTENPPETPESSLTLDAALDGLRRRPDLETAELRAWDAADRYLLDTAEPWLRERPAEVVVIDDTHGALTLGALALGAHHVRVHQDSLVAQRALEANAADVTTADAAKTGFSQHSLADVMTPNVRLVLLRLPRSLDALDSLARAIACSAHPEVIVVTGNMIKHMTPTQNDVLRRSFGQVDVSLARGKARLVTARLPRATEAVGDSPLALAEPARAHDAELDLHVVARAGVFAGAAVDLGTRALIESWGQLPQFETAIDLGCGSGVLASLLARRSPTAHIIATDFSAAAVESARLTAEANGVAVEVVHDDGLSLHDHGSADLIVLNPPFHVGAAVHTGVANALFAEAGRVLRPGGQLWCVWNSHLAYTPVLERTVGPTRQVSRGSKFTVTVSRKR